MEYRRLGRTDLRVSRICLGTMTWGTQNTEAEAFAQLDHALDQGINFLDTAEMYSIPPTAESFGKTETCIGNWFRERNNRDKVILATKVTGPNPRFDWIRGGRNGLDRGNIEAAVEGSLRRLRTDYIDLYQLHWPHRRTNMFGRLDYTHDPNEEHVAPEETLEVLADLVRAGKVRHVGLSNDSPWGVMRFLHLAEASGDAWPRVVSVQNPYSLLNRSFEIGLAEIAHREEVGLLAYSPLAGGTLSGKYLGGRIPPGSRRAIDGRGSRYATPRGDAATEAYVGIARKHGLDPAQMALAFVNSRPFLTSNIIGATSMEQLTADIASEHMILPQEVLADLEAVHRDNPNPCP